MSEKVLRKWSILGTQNRTGADPRFLERGFICIHACGWSRFADFVSIFLNILLNKSLARINKNCFLLEQMAFNYKISAEMMV